MTAEELWLLPSRGQRHELVRGELRTMAPGNFEHGAVGINLSTPMAMHNRAHDLGVVVAAETGFILGRDPDTVRAPDIAFVSKKKIEASGIPKTFYPGAPDIAVEVVSPGNTINEVDEKVQDWLDAGAQLVWVVNPRQRNVTAYAASAKPVILSENDILDGGEVFPGFAIKVNELFQ